MIVVPRDVIARHTAAGWWGTATLVDAFERNVRERPAREAVVDPPNRAALMDGTPQRLSWTALGALVERLAAILAARGVGPDGIVCTQLPNCVEQVATYLACLRLGAVITPVPMQYREHEIEYVLGHTGAATIVTCARFHHHAHAAMMAGAAATAPAVREVLAFGGDSPAGVGALDTLAAPGPAPRHAGDANDVVSICWTSGTEANPKGVPRSHNEWLIVVPSIAEGGALAPGARILNPFPMVNMAGFSTGFATWLALGGTLVQHHPFDLAVFLAQLRDETIDYTVAAPAILNRLLQERDLVRGIDFRRLSRIGSGSAPLSPWMVAGFHDAFGVEIVNYFGSNEGAALTGSPEEIPDRAVRAQFFPRAGVAGFDWRISTAKKIRTRLVDPATEAEITDPGVAGELRFAGPTIFSGYFRAPELTRRAFDARGYYRSGDTFQIAGDRGQYYRFVGRTKDIVNRGGMKISAEEIETLLMEHPAVQEAAVVGLPDAKFGERVCACVVARAGATLDPAALTAFLRDAKRLATFKLPERVELLDALPRNAVGKIVKRALRERFGPPG